MVKRFASGDSELKQSEAGRFRRGAPRLTKQKATSIKQEQPQQKPSVPREQQIEERAREIAIEAVQRKLRGQRISFFVNKGDTSIEGRARDRAKDIYADLARKPDIQQALSDAAEQKIRAQELGFGQNVKEFRAAQGFAQPRGRQFVEKQPKQAVTDLEGGGFTVTKRNASGQEVTQFFDKEGREIFAQSGIGLTQRQAVARDFFIKTGVLKEKDKPKNFRELSPLPTVILNTKPLKTSQFASGDLVIQGVRAPTKKERFDFTQEHGLGTKQIIVQRFKQVGVGITQAGISVTEGLGTVAVNFNPRLDAPQTKLAGIPIATRFRLEDTNISPRSKQFIVDIKNAPRGTGTFLGKTLVFAPLVGASVASTAVNIQSLGVKEGLKATAASFSPIRIKPGTFGPLEGPKAEKIRFDAVAITKNQGIKTTRVVVGQDTQKLGASLISRQQFAKVGSLDVGGARTTVTGPTFTITPGGSLVQGQRVLTIDSAIVGKAGAVSKLANVGGRPVVLSGLPEGFAGRVASITRADLLLTNAGSFGTLNIGPTGTKNTVIGGFTQKIAGTDTRFFVAGNAAKGIKITSTKISEVVRVPTSQIKISGIELKAPTPSKSFGFVSLGKSPTKTIVQQSAALTAGALNVKPTAAAPKGSFTAPPTIKLERQTQTSINSQAQQIRQSQNVKLNQAPKLEVSQRVSQGQRARTIPSLSLQSVSASLQTPRTTPVVLTTSAQAQQTRTRQALRLTTLQVSPPTAQIPTIAAPQPRPTPFGGPLIFANPKSSGGPRLSFTIEVRRRGVFRPVARAPSARQATRLGALITGSTLAASFRIKVPKPTKLVTPRGFRRKREDGGIVFVERRSLRLSKPGEIKGIQAARIKLPSFKV